MKAQVLQGSPEEEFIGLVINYFLNRIILLWLVFSSV